LQWSSGDLHELNGASWDYVVLGKKEKSEPMDYNYLASGVKVNKMPGTSSLCRKDLLWNNFRQLKLKFGSEIFNFLPQTFNIPEEWDQLKKAMTDSNEVWIAKPIAGACGNGIRLATTPGELRNGKSALSVQKYITNPFLINGLKFDLRLYVLVTNIDPIKIYIYEDGLVRFATKLFSMKDDDIGDKFIHLTNYSINKKNKEFEFNETPENLSGHKWSLQMLWKYLETIGINYSTIWEEIKDLIVKTIFCGHQAMKSAFMDNVQSNYNCYKLFGFDVLIDDTLKPWLLEVNNFPAMNHKTIDRHVNEPMIAEMLNIVGFHITETIDVKRETSIIYKNGLASMVKFDPQMYSRNRNVKQLKKERDWITKKQIVFNLEKLSPMDVRTLLQAEEELEQTLNFSRLFPCKTLKKYEDLYQRQSYNDSLLEAWENEYGSKPSRGREVLVSLCLEGVHTADTE